MSEIVTGPVAEAVAAGGGVQGTHGSRCRSHQLSSTESTTSATGSKLTPSAELLPEPALGPEPEPFDAGTSVVAPSSTPPSATPASTHVSFNKSRDAHADAGSTSATTQTATKVKNIVAEVAQRLGCLNTFVCSKCHALKQAATPTRARSQIPPACAPGRSAPLGRPSPQSYRLRAWTNRHRGTRPRSLW